jgi:hypothetical protein
MVIVISLPVAQSPQYGSVSAKSLILPSPPTPLSCRFFIRGFPPNKNAAPKLGRGEPEPEATAG